MRRTSVRKDILFLLLALAALLITLFVLFFFGAKSYGHISVYAVDAYSLEPVADAVVVLPQNGMQAETDARGKAEFYNIPIEKNPFLEKLYAQNFGQITVLCYKNGYQPYALFFAQIRPNKVREDLTLYLFPEGTEAGCVIEAPPEDWIKRVLAAYEPHT